MGRLWAPSPFLDFGLYNLNFFLKDFGYLLVHFPETPGGTGMTARLLYKRPDIWGRKAGSIQISLHCTTSLHNKNVNNLRYPVRIIIIIFFFVSDVYTDLYNLHFVHSPAYGYPLSIDWYFRLFNIEGKPPLFTDIYILYISTTWEGPSRRDDARRQSSAPVLRDGWRRYSPAYPGAVATGLC